MHNDVRRLRAARALSQAALAQAMGVSRQTINAIETGRYLPSLPLAIGLARFFETTVEDLFRPEPGEIPT
jgi:putative transcriptional regulator